MIGKLFRFHGYGGVRAIMRQGQTVRGQYLSLKYLTNRGPDRPYRAAVVISRKVSKSAPLRNRIRRRIYEIVRNHQAELRPGADLVISGFDARLATMDHTELEAHVLSLLRKAHLLKEE